MADQREAAAPCPFIIDDGSGPRHTSLQPLSSGPPHAVRRATHAVAPAALKLPGGRAKFREQGAEPQGQSRGATAAFIKEEEARWRTVIKSANVRLE